MFLAGLYQALLQRERERQDCHDGFVVATCLSYERNRKLLDALEAGEPATVVGRNLKGWGIPKVGLQRDQAFDRFRVSPDDIVSPVKSEVPES